MTDQGAEIQDVSKATTGGVSYKKDIFKNFSKFTGKHLCQGFFFNKAAGIFAGRQLLKKALWHKCFPVNFAKFLRTPFLKNTSGRWFLVFQATL